MRYERSSPGQAEAGTASRRTRRIVLAGTALVAVGGSLAGLAASPSRSGAVATSSARARGLEHVVVEAAVLENDLGAPAPPGRSGDWALRSIALRTERSVSGRYATVLEAPSYRWVAADGTVRPLSTSQAGEILSSQRAAIAAVAERPFAATLAGQLASIVAGERRTPPAISAPGGASVLTWFSVEVNGATARVDGQLEIWDERISIAGPRGDRRLAASVRPAQIEVIASLRRSGGTWRVSSLVETPYQQPT